MARFAIVQVDPLELDRRAYDSLFDLMEEYQAEHPEASEDEAFEAVCFGRPQPTPQEKSRNG